MFIKKRLIHVEVYTWWFKPGRKYGRRRRQQRCQIGSDAS